MVLQALEGRSDRDACRALQTDLAWKAAAGLAITDEAFHPTVLTLWRNKLRASEAPQRIFDAVRAVIAESKVLEGRHRRAIDSTVLDDAVARQDTVTMLVEGLLRWPIAVGWGEAVWMKRRRSCPVIQTGSATFAGYRFPPEVILLSVRWYLRFGLSYRDLEELLAERGVDVDHVTLFRWVQRFTPALVDAARPCRHVAGDRWFVDETYVKVAGHWRYVYRAVDQYGQVVDVLVSDKRDTVAATRFFTAAIGSHGVPAEVTTDRAHALAKVIEDLLPAAVHDTRQYANNRVEADHGRLKARLRPMRGLKRTRRACQGFCVSDGSHGC